MGFECALCGAKFEIPLQRRTHVCTGPLGAPYRTPNSAECSLTAPSTEVTQASYSAPAESSPAAPSENPPSAPSENPPSAPSENPPSAPSENPRTASVVQPHAPESQPHAPESQPNEVDKYKAKGDYGFKNRLYKQAIADYSAAIQLAPHNHVLYSNRSASHLALVQELMIGCASPAPTKSVNHSAQTIYQHKHGALMDALMCLDLNRTWPKAYSRLGSALHELKMLDEAAQAFEDGLAIEPANPVLQTGLKRVAQAGYTKPCAILPAAEAVQRLKRSGNVYLAANRIEEAIECYTKAIEDAENRSLGLLAAVCYGNRAAAYFILGGSSIQAAENDARKASELDSHYIWGYARLCKAFLLQQDSAAVEMQRLLDAVESVDLYQLNVKDVLDLGTNLVAVLNMGSSLSQHIAAKLEEMVCLLCCSRSHDLQ